MQSKYPMHAKLAAVKDQSQACGDFLDWLSSKGLFLAAFHTHKTSCYRLGLLTCGFSDRYPYRVGGQIDELLAQFFGVDLKKLELEKRKMAPSLREAS